MVFITTILCLLGAWLMMCAGAMIFIIMKVYEEPKNEHAFMKEIR